MRQIFHSPRSNLKSFPYKTLSWSSTILLNNEQQHFLFSSSHFIRLRACQRAASLNLTFVIQTRPDSAVHVNHFCALLYIIALQWCKELLSIRVTLTCLSSSAVPLCVCRSLRLILTSDGYSDCGLRSKVAWGPQYNRAVMNLLTRSDFTLRAVRVVFHTAAGRGKVVCRLQLSHPAAPSRLIRVLDWSAAKRKLL